MMKFYGNEFEKVLYFFKEISAIPRGSFHETAIAAYLCDFAQTRGLWVYRDERNNVLIKKAASAGMEGHPAVLLQGHTDMVCEKNAATVHDFENDGIALIFDGDFVRADGTTLGADDGAAVAIMLALLDGNTIPLPALECLFTVCEEVGLQGASGFDCSLLDARLMINLDSETEDEVTVSCAGGVKSQMVLPLGEMTEAPALTPVSVFISGLAGGHSGADIHLQRGNANKIAARLLLVLEEQLEVRLHTINGGNKDNAIPRECGFIIGVQDLSSVSKLIFAEVEKIRQSLVDADAAFSVKIENTISDLCYASAEKTRLLGELLNATPDGVIAMSRTITGMVETSSNMGIICTEGNTVKITFAPRSSSEAQLDAVMRRLDSFAYLAGAAVVHNNRYPGWDAVDTSPLRDRYGKAFSDIKGYPPTILGIHAGLECGLIKSKVPDMDMISVGPNIYDIHTPDERMSLSSLNRLFSILCRVLTTL